MNLNARITVTPTLIKEALQEVAGVDAAAKDALANALKTDSFAPFETELPASVAANPAQLLAFLITSLAGGKTVPMADMPGATSAPTGPQEAPRRNHGAGKRAARTYGREITGVKNLKDILHRAPHLGKLVHGMVESDVSTILGRTPQDIRLRFDLGAEWTDDRITQFVASATGRIHFATERVGRHISANGFVDAQWSGLSASDQQKVLGQHSNYAAGILARDWHVDKQAARGVMQIFLASPDDSSSARNVLADQLTRLAPTNRASAMRTWIESSEQDWLFHPDSCRAPAAVIKNLASEYSGAAVLAMAEEVVGGSTEAASGLLNQIFRRSDYELSEQLRNTSGAEGMLLHLAASCNHLTWGAATLGIAVARAQDGDEAATNVWRHKDLKPSWIVLAEDASAAPKLVDQLEAFMFSSGMMIPRDRSTTHGKVSQMEILNHVFDSGIYSNNTDATISLNARRITDVAIDKLQRFGTLSSIYAGAGAQATAEVVAEIAATFAGKATHTSELELNALKRLYYSSLTKLMPEVLNLFEMRQDASTLRTSAEAEMSAASAFKTDEARARAMQSAEQKSQRADNQMEEFDRLYGQLYSTFAGQVGHEALAEQIGEANAQDTARQTGLIDLCRSAARNLRMDIPPEYLIDPNLIADDIESLGSNLMKDDYFLGDPEFMNQVREDAAKKLPVARREEFSSYVEHAARLPNAIWFFVSLVRGLVQPDRLKRFESSGLHSNPKLLTKDAFPDALQFNMPDVRDVDLFHWAQHRLSKYHAKNEQTAQRQAFAVVVLTLYKDLVQIQKGAGVR